MEIPKSVAADPDSVEIFCDTFAEKADPIDEQAVATWALCVQRADELGVTGAWREQCRAAYNQRVPGEPLP
jgi:hypothetical protein